MKKHLVFVILLFLGKLSICNAQDGNINTIYTPDNVKHTEQYYKYPGGKDGLIKDITNNFDIPTQALKDKLKGKILLQIKIDTLGIASGKILESLREDVDNAAIEMVKKLKQSEPAKMDDKKVEFTMTIPLKL